MAKPPKSPRKPRTRKAPDPIPVSAQTKMGRPTLYKPEFIQQVTKLCELGATDIELADFFEIDVATLNRWKLVHADFCAAIKMGKEAADERVERSLFARATGYSYPAVKIMQNNGEPVEHAYREHIPPDTVAAIFWLKNRRNKRWSDKSEVEIKMPLADRVRRAKERTDGKK